MSNGNANASTDTGNSDSSVPPMTSSVPNASTKPSSPKIAWSRGAWSSGGRRHRVQRDLREEYDRFLNEQAPRLTEEERSRILAVSADIPALWHASETTARDRKEIIRLLTKQIVVNVRADTERAEVTITWRGGQTTRHEIVRPVSRYESLWEYDRMMDRIVQLRRDGLTIKELAIQLTREGYCAARTQKGYTSTSVRQLLSAAD